MGTESGMPPVSAPARDRHGPITDQLTVAFVGRPPVFLDLAASTARVVEVIAEAGRDGAQLIVFPETWLPGAVPLPRCCSSLGCATHSPQRFLFFAPICARYQLMPLNIAAPASSAVIADRPFSRRNESLISPPTTTASWTPAPNPMTARDRAVPQFLEKQLGREGADKQPATRHQAP